MKKLERALSLPLIVSLPVAVALFVSLAWVAWCEDAPKPEPPRDQPAGAPKAEAPKDKIPKSDPLAVQLFDAAVAWQGKPTQAAGKLIDLEIDQMDFKVWGDNEVEGRFKILYTAPNKVWFNVWTKAWWRRYGSDGEIFWRRTGSSNSAEILNPKDKDDSDGIALLGEALRIVRLVLLENHRTPDAVFKYMELQRPKGRADAPACHLVKRQPVKDDDPAGVVYFYLSQKDQSPVCIGILDLLKVEGVFFIHLSGFADFQGVKFPTRIEIYRIVKDQAEKFLFADVIRDADRGTKVEVNGGIDDEIYLPGK